MFAHTKTSRSPTSVGQKHSRPHWPARAGGQRQTQQSDASAGLSAWMAFHLSISRRTRTPCRLEGSPSDLGGGGGGIHTERQPLRATKSGHAASCCLAVLRQRKTRRAAAALRCAAARPPRSHRAKHRHSAPPHLVPHIAALALEVRRVLALDVLLPGRPANKERRARQQQQRGVGGGRGRRAPHRAARGRRAAAGPRHRAARARPHVLLPRPLTSQLVSRPDRDELANTRYREYAAL